MIKILVVVLTMSGVFGTLLPVLPGTPLIVIAAVIYSIINDFQVISVSLLAILIILSILAETLEYIISAIGAKKYGASNYGILASFVGGILGLLILGPLGVLLGIIIGIIILEMILGKNLTDAIRIAFGGLMGALGGSIFSLLVALLMASLLLSKVI
jgi:uncharacterized protein YqgC (DUF456 family)